MIAIFTIYKPEDEVVMVASFYRLIKICDKWYIQDVSGNGIGWSLRSVELLGKDSEIDALVHSLDFVHPTFKVGKFDHFQEAYYAFIDWAAANTEGLNWRW